MKGTAKEPKCKYSQEISNIVAFYSEQARERVDIPKYYTVNVKDDLALKESVKEFSHWPTIPQLYVKGKFVGGHEAIKDMHRDGRLEDLFTKEGLLSSHNL